MKYRTNHPSQDFSAALSLEKKTVSRLDKAIEKAIQEVGNNMNPAGWNIDEINGFIAPYIHTAEEAFYVAYTIAGQVEAALLGHYSAGN